MSVALYSFQKATDLRPDYGPYLYNYALALVAAQRLDEARTQAQAAVKADPSLAEVHVLLGGLFERDQRLAEAVGEYQQAVKLQPAFSLAHLDLGLVLAAQGDLRSAAEHLRKAAAGSDPNVVRQAAQALQQISNH
jgi:tetratricopeptide (TPR) repeat protein